MKTNKRITVEEEPTGRRKTARTIGKVLLIAGLVTIMFFAFYLALLVVFTIPLIVIGTVLMHIGRTRTSVTTIRDDSQGK
jgi:hypothetical protein